MNNLFKEADTVEKLLHYHLARIYQRNNAWAITAWEIERLADEKLGPDYMETVRQLRSSLYAYISSLGAEWPAEEENNIVLNGTYIEAAKTLKALWLSLHLVYMNPLEPRVEQVEPWETYETLNRYTRLVAKALRLKPIPFKLADRLLGLASLTAMLAGVVYPEHFEETGAVIITADMLWALTRARIPARRS